MHFQHSILVVLISVSDLHGFFYIHGWCTVRKLMDYFAFHLLFFAHIYPKESLLTSHSMCGTRGVKKLRSMKVLCTIKKA